MLRRCVITGIPNRRFTSDKILIIIRCRTTEIGETNSDQKVVKEEMKRRFRFKRKNQKDEKKGT
jgi:hypothetical protein